jgi:hypothetical protein
LSKSPKILIITLTPDPGRERRRRVRPAAGGRLAGDRDNQGRGRQRLRGFGVKSFGGKKSCAAPPEVRLGAEPAGEGEAEADDDEALLEPPRSRSAQVSILYILNFGRKFKYFYPLMRAKFPPKITEVNASNKIIEYLKQPKSIKIQYRYIHLYLTLLFGYLHSPTY